MFANLANFEIIFDIVLKLKDRKVIQPFRWGGLFMHAANFLCFITQRYILLFSSFSKFGHINTICNTDPKKIENSKYDWLIQLWQNYKIIPSSIGSKL